MKLRFYFCLIATSFLVFSSVFTPYIKASTGGKTAEKVEQTDLNEEDKDELRRQLEV